MQTIPAREIKRRGMAAVDIALREGPVHVVRNDRPTYVVLGEDPYRELVAERHEVFLADVRASVDDLAAGRVRRTTAGEQIAELGLEA